MFLVKQKQIGVGPKNEGGQKYDLDGFINFFFFLEGPKISFWGGSKYFCLGGINVRRKTWVDQHFFFVCWAVDKKMDGEGIKTRSKFYL